MVCKVNAQENIVLNGSFEENKIIKNCEGCLDQFKIGFFTEVTNWKNSNLSGIAIDPFLECSSNQGIIAKTGSCYIRLLLGYNNNFGFANRSFIQTKLKKPLIKNHIYKVSLFIYFQYTNLHTRPCYRNLRMCFSENNITKLPINLEIKVNNPDSLIPMREWKEISATFIAKGGEQFLLLGSLEPFNKDEIFKQKEQIPCGIDDVSIMELGTLKEIYDITKIKVGETITFDKIYFEKGSYVIQKKSVTTLFQIIKLLNDNPTLKIEIYGFSDNSEDDQKNILMTNYRAKAVYDYLINNGIESNQLSQYVINSVKPIQTDFKEKLKIKILQK